MMEDGLEKGRKRRAHGRHPGHGRRRPLGFRKRRNSSMKPQRKIVVCRDVDLQGGCAPARVGLKGLKSSEGSENLRLRPGGPPGLCQDRMRSQSLSAVRCSANMANSPYLRVEVGGFDRSAAPKKSASLASFTNQFVTGAITCRSS